MSKRRNRSSIYFILFFFFSCLRFSSLSSGALSAPLTPSSSSRQWAAKGSSESGAWPSGMLSPLLRLTKGGTSISRRRAIIVVSSGSSQDQSAELIQSNQPTVSDWFAFLWIPSTHFAYTSGFFFFFCLISRLHSTFRYMVDCFPRIRGREKTKKEKWNLKRPTHK